MSSATTVDTVVMMTVHNRRDLSVRAVQSCRASAMNAGVSIHFVVHDDGSTDGTSEALRALGLPMSILPGDGSAFWAKGMARAEAAALAIGPKHLLWLNDDVDVDPDAFSVLVAGRRGGESRILVGATRDPDTGAMTYSGFSMRNRHPLGVAQVEPQATERGVVTFNGNFVSVPADVARRLSGIDGSFAHAMADIDYGFRATSAGIPVVLLPGTIGRCRGNPEPGRELGVRAEWRQFVGIKGAAHPRSLLRLLRKHARHSWWFYFPATYALWAARHLVPGPPPSRHGL